MKKNPVYAFLLFILIHVGCENIDKNITKSKYSSSFNESNIFNLHADSFFFIKKVLPLETSEESIINGISQIFFTDSLVFIFDEEQQKILCFDRNDGSFIRRIGEHGRGPNEYLYITSIFFDTHEQLLYANDLAQLKMLVFKPNGDFLKTIKSEYGFRSFCKSNNSFWVWSCYEQSQLEEKYNLLELCNNLSELKSKHFPTNNFFDRREPMYCFSIVDDQIYFAYGFNPQIYQIVEGDVRPFYLVDNLLRNITYQELKTLRNKEEYDSKRFLNFGNYKISSTNYLVSYSRIYFTIGQMSKGLVRNIGHVYDYLQDESLFYESISHNNLLLSMIPIAIHKNKVVFIMYPGFMAENYFPITNEAYNINLNSESNPCVIFTMEKELPRIIKH